MRFFTTSRSSVKQLITFPIECTDRYPDVPWRHIAGMRNIVVHVYADVDLEIVWETVTARLGPLKDAVQAMLSEAG